MLTRRVTIMGTRMVTMIMWTRRIMIITVVGLSSKMKFQETML